jgi:hypothetical protein
MSREKPPTLTLEEQRQKRRDELEGTYEALFRKVVSGDTMEGAELHSEAGAYTVFLGVDTLEKLFTLADARGVKVAVLIRKAVAQWLEGNA